MTDQNNKKTHEVTTLLRLIAPEFVDVELVPLSSVERAEFLFFWSTVFLTVWGTVAGTWLSLTLVDYQNQPVLYLLVAVLVFLSILVVSFSVAGFHARRKTRQAARSSSPAVAKLSVTEKMDRVNVRIIELLSNEFTEHQFKELVNRFDRKDNDAELQTAMFNRLVQSGAAEVVEGTSDPIRYRARQTAQAHQNG